MYSEQLRTVKTGSNEWQALIIEYRQHIPNCPQCQERLKELENLSSHHPELVEAANG
jgi:hypothetical protein